MTTLSRAPSTTSTTWTTLGRTCQMRPTPPMTSPAKWSSTNWPRISNKIGGQGRGSTIPRMTTTTSELWGRGQTPLSVEAGLGTPTQLVAKLRHVFGGFPGHFRASELHSGERVWPMPAFTPRWSTAGRRIHLKTSSSRRHCAKLNQMWYSVRTFKSYTNEKRTKNRPSAMCRRHFRRIAKKFLMQKSWEQCRCSKQIDNGIKLPIWHCHAITTID